MLSHTRQQHCTRLAWMLRSADDHREQRPQLCGALTGELKTGPWAGNKTLERCRNAEHSGRQRHTTHCHSQVALPPLPPLPLNFLQPPWNRAVFKWLEQRTLMLSCAQTCQVRNCSYRTVNDTQGGGKLCMVSLYLGLLTHINCRLTKRIINPLKVHKSERGVWAAVVGQKAKERYILMLLHNSFFYLKTLT